MTQESNLAQCIQLQLRENRLVKTKTLEFKYVRNYNECSREIVLLVNVKYKNVSLIVTSNIVGLQILRSFEIYYKCSSIIIIIGLRYSWKFHYPL